LGGTTSFGALPMTTARPAVSVVGICEFDREAGMAGHGQAAIGAAARLAACSVHAERRRDRAERDRLGKLAAGFSIGVVAERAARDCCVGCKG
jgi:hypothetical protein